MSNKYREKLKILRLFLWTLGYWGKNAENIIKNFYIYLTFGWGIWYNGFECGKKKVKKVRTHSFNGKCYNVVFEKFDGATDVDKSPRDMLIAAHPNTQNELITIIHEAMHAGNWDKHEETIDRSSKEIGRFLWRLGYRRKNNNFSLD